MVNSQARISVAGLLTETPDLLSWWYGLPNTLYSDIADAINFVEREKSVKHVTFDVESGGGTVAGLRTATQAISTMTKSRSVVSSFAASAAFWLSCEVGKIEAKHDLSEFGSIGVAVRMAKWAEVHDIASTNAPNKRPDPSTDEGKAIVRLELDAIHEKFASAVASGRGRATGKSYSIELVNTEFGRGGMILAEDALKRGMIDAIRTGADDSRGRVSVQSGGTPNSGPSAKKKNMDAKQLKDEHRDVYDAVYRAGREAALKESEEKLAAAVKEAAEKAVAQERDRVNAHLNFTKKKSANSGNILKIAHEAIRKGTELNQTMLSEYLTAEDDAQALNERESEDGRVPSTSSASGDDKGADLGDMVMARRKARRGAVEGHDINV